MDTAVDHQEKPDQGTRERNLLAIVGELARELHPQHVRAGQISLSSRLERDLGIDSLGRTELVLRLERAFGARLPIRLVGEADTVGDLLLALEQADQSGATIGAAPAAPSLTAIPAATEARTLLDVLEGHAARHPDRLHVTVLEDDATVVGSMTYRALAEAARAIAVGLIERDVMPGDRVALMLPTSVDFFAAFFGVLYAGAVPVPIYPPMQRSQIEDYARRQAGILRNAGARLLITVPEALRLGSILQGLVATLSSVDSAATLSARASEVPLPNLQNGSATALIQYTSGSTGEPKGVVLSHANLLANIRGIGRAVEASSADVFVSWLPLYHDMGLIGAWLGCLYYGAPLYAMSPLSFLARPQSWLWAIHRFRGTISAAPNFAFELCLNKIDDADLQGLDLGSLRLVGNGAEPVSVETLRRFIDRFARYGFRPGAMAPVYGLAENAVAVTLPPPGRSPIIDRVNRIALSTRGTSPADSRFPITRSASSTIWAVSSASDRKGASNFAVHRRHRATFRTQPRHVSCSTMAGSTPATVAISRAAISSSPVGSRTSSSGPVNTSRRTRSKRRSEPFPASARTASPPSASPIRPPARSASWSWPRRRNAIPRRRQP